MYGYTKSKNSLTANVIHLLFCCDFCAQWTYVTARLQYPQKCVIYEQNLRLGEIRGWDLIMLHITEKGDVGCYSKMQEPGVRFEL